MFTVLNFCYSKFIDPRSPAEKAKDSWTRPVLSAAVDLVILHRLYKGSSAGSGSSTFLPDFSSTRVKQITYLAIAVLGYLVTRRSRGDTPPSTPPPVTKKPEDLKPQPPKTLETKAVVKACPTTSVAALYEAESMVREKKPVSEVADFLLSTCQLPDFCQKLLSHPELITIGFDYWSENSVWQDLMKREVSTDNQFVEKLMKLIHPKLLMHIFGEATLQDCFKNAYCDRRREIVASLVKFCGVRETTLLDLFRFLPEDDFYAQCLIREFTARFLFGVRIAPLPCFRAVEELESRDITLFQTQMLEVEAYTPAFYEVGYKNLFDIGPGIGKLTPDKPLRAIASALVTVAPENYQFVTSEELIGEALDELSGFRPPASRRWKDDLICLCSLVTSKWSDEQIVAFSKEMPPSFFAVLERRHQQMVYKKLDWMTRHFLTRVLPHLFSSGGPVKDDTIPAVYTLPLEKLGTEELPVAQLIESSTQSEVSDWTKVVPHIQALKSVSGRDAVLLAYQMRKHKCSEEDIADVLLKGCSQPGFREAWNEIELDWPVRELLRIGFEYHAENGQWFRAVRKLLKDWPELPTILIRMCGIQKALEFFNRDEIRESLKVAHEDRVEAFATSVLADPKRRESFVDLIELAGDEHIPLITRIFSSQMLLGNKHKVNERNINYEAAIPYWDKEVAPKYLATKDDFQASRERARPYNDVWQYQYEAALKCQNIVADFSHSLEEFKAQMLQLREARPDIYSSVFAVIMIHDKQDYSACDPTLYRNKFHLWKPIEAHNVRALVQTLIDIAPQDYPFYKKGEMEGAYILDWMVSLVQDNWSEEELKLAPQSALVVLQETKGKPIWEETIELWVAQEASK